nr:ribonuclease H-like domain-containing protein [Tanacetum cinerariifolium]GEZ65248.1 ribonuclease H-like domain-containing protein [Tanacetum cinerariifolium]
ADCSTARRSTLGYCVFLGNSLLSRSSKRQVTLFSSSVEVEYRGVDNVVVERFWLRNLLQELHTPLLSAPSVYCDYEGPYVLRDIFDPPNEGKIRMQKEEDISDKELAQYKADIKLKNILIFHILALILHNMALLGTQIQNWCYDKPTNNDLWITYAPTAQYKRQDCLPRNEMNDLYVDTDDEGEQLEANVVFMARLEKMKAFEAEHVSATEASGDNTQLNETFLIK